MTEATPRYCSWQLFGEFNTNFQVLSGSNRALAPKRLPHDRTGTLAAGPNVFEAIQGVGCSTTWLLPKRQNDEN